MKGILSRARSVKHFFSDPFFRIRKLPRFKPGQVTVGDMKIFFPDAASFIAIYDEIFQRYNYKFVSENKTPLIIDCGANIGIGTLYFKQLYPESEIIAFEPDASVFSYLEKNVGPLHDKRVTLINKGLWNKDGEIEFLSEGSDSGKLRLGQEGPAQSVTKVQVVRLSNYINREVGFLKIDIEGAELDVLKEIESKLSLVRNIFIEYHSFAGRRQELDVLLKILTENGFRYYIYAPTPLRREPFVDHARHHSMDCLLNICAER